MGAVSAPHAISWELGLWLTAVKPKIRWTGGVVETTGLRRSRGMDRL